MIIRTSPVGPWAMNAHVLVCPDTKKSVLIDPGADPQILIQMLDGTKPQAILITHSHMDHVGALEQMRQQLNVPVMAHPGIGPASSVNADQWLEGGERLPVGDHVVTTYPAPGHADDQICYGVESANIFVVGDTVFEGGPGKTWSVQGFQTTLNTLRTVVLSWPEDAVCYPGHGPSFRLGDKRSAIQRFAGKDHGNFFGDAEW